MQEKVAYDRLQFVYQKGNCLWVPDGNRHLSQYVLLWLTSGPGRLFPRSPTRAATCSSHASSDGRGLTRDDILDNITITWLTNTALSGARLYWERFGSGVFQRQRRVHPGCRQALLP